MCLAIPGRVEEVYEKDGLRTGKVRFGGVAREAVLEHVPEAREGSWVLVHVGFALQVVDEAEAKKTYELLKELDELEGS